jgi:DNA ligase (NAD+)
LKIDVPKFFKGLGIPGAGETAGKTLIAHYKDFEPIRVASESELQKIDGIGPTTAKNIVDWFKINNDLVTRLLDHVELDLPKTGKLTGKNFVLTGAFAKGKKHWEALIEDQGGNIQSSVGSSTNYLIQELGKNDGSPSDKEKKAAKYGTKVISIADLEKML